LGLWCLKALPKFLQRNQVHWLKFELLSMESFFDFVHRDFEFLLHHCCILHIKKFKLKIVKNFIFNFKK
jgi:hypothetical protein